MLAKSLNELAPFVGQNVPNARGILSLLCDGRMQIMTIYDHFQINIHSTTEEAANAIKGMEHTSLKKYGSHLVILLKKMVHLAVEPGEDTYHSISNDLSLANTLNGLGARYSARNLAETVLERAIKMEQPRLAYEAARILMRCHVATEFAKRKEFQDFLELAEKFEPMAATQLNAEVLFLNQLSYKQFKRGANKERIDYLVNAEEILRPQAGVIESQSFHSYYYSIACDALLYRGKYDELVQKIEEAIAYYASRPYEIKGNQAIYHAFMAFICGVLGRFIEGEQHLEKSLELGRPGAINWFSSLLCGIQMYLRMPNPDAAAALYTRGRRHKNFINLNSSMAERWHIIGAYLYLLLTTHGNELPKGMPNYTYTKFRNEITIFHADKNGLFAAALIAELLLALKENRTDLIVDRLEGLEKYRERYLLEEGTPRTAQLLKILIYMGQMGFQKSLYRDKLPALCAQMEAMPHEGLEFEIIPNELVVDLAESMAAFNRDSMR
jgi:tetratricopeptide (TPR) repeat protein